MNISMFKKTGTLLASLWLMGVPAGISALTPTPSASLQAAGIITGRVLGPAGQPLASVQVFLSAVNLGALTQANGRYLIQNAPAGTYTLTAERIGYRSGSVQITVSNGQTVEEDFALVEAALRLDELIVTGTAGGTQRRALGNSVARVNVAAERDLLSGATFEEILGNRVPGVALLAPSGVAGGGAKIRIRGSSSLALPGDPLIYVDGIRVDQSEAFPGRFTSVSTLDDIDPASIESIEIIKGPAAATLYGTEAANGVIQIITKKGVVGAPSFDVAVGVGGIWLPDPAGKVGEQFFINAAGEVDSRNPYIEEMQPAPFFGKPLFQTGLAQNYSVGVRGGSESVLYAAGIDRMMEEGYTRIDDNEKTSARLSLTMIPSDKLTITLNGSESLSKTQDPGLILFRLDGLARPGQFDQILRGWGGETLDARLKGRTDVVTANHSTWSLNIEHNPTSWFIHKVTAGVDRNALENTVFTRKSDDLLVVASYGDNAREGDKSITNLERQTLTLDYSASVRLQLTDRLGSVTSAGLQYFGRENTSKNVHGEEFAVPALSTVGAASSTEASESFVENNTVGSYVQNEFSWEDRVFLTGAVRFDKNSAFGKEAGGELYPKLSAAWVLSEESFWEGSGFGSAVPEIRLRSAWGASGQQPDAFAAQRLYQSRTGPGGLPMLSPSVFGNPDLGPERGEEIEIGFDAGLLDNRMSFEFTWYSRSTKEAIVARPIRPSQGFPGTQFINVGEIKAGGTETVLNFQVVRGEGLQWDVTPVFSTNWSRITDMGGLSQIVALGFGGSSRNQYHVEGFPVGGFFDIKVLSADFVSGTSGPVENAMCDGGTGIGEREQGGAAVPCAGAPEVFYGQSTPAWNFVLNNSLTWGNWTLRASVDMKGGHHIQPDYLAGADQRHSERLIRQDNTIWTALRKHGARGGINMSYGDFAKLRELTLRYRFSDAMAGRIGSERASISFSGYNVATLWTKQGKFTDMGARLHDVEGGAPNKDNGGVDMGGFPPASRFTVRMNVSF
jgi:TonB-linked SusC/RagA family outer membrane protein